MVEHGDGILWIDPGADYIPMRESVNRRRGDVGAIKLHGGITLRGRVLESDGRPIAEMDVFATMQGQRPSPDSIDRDYSIRKRAKPARTGSSSLRPYRREITQSMFETIQIRNNLGCNHALNRRLYRSNRRNHRNLSIFEHSTMRAPP